MSDFDKIADGFKTGMTIALTILCLGMLGFIFVGICVMIFK